MGRLDREASEITLLAEQTRSEVERHRSRATQGEQRVADLERAARTDPLEVSRARNQLLAITQRAILMEGQQEVLDGKQNMLTRYRERLAQLADAIDTALAPLEGESDAVDDADTVSAPPTQEDLRREIARQMHDGPAQSLANIALQAEVVGRQMARDPSLAAAEIEQLQRTVQRALDATKSFIFDVRPMVLDDLGLVPTIRRAAADRGRRSDVPIDFDSIGAELRLEPELESGVFRIIDDALVGYLSLQPSAISIRIEWTAGGLEATVRNGGPSDRASAPSANQDAASADVPAALATMIARQRADERGAWTSKRTLPAGRWLDIQKRAKAAGLAVRLTDEGQTVEVVVGTGD